MTKMKWDCKCDSHALFRVIAICRVLDLRYILRHNYELYNQLPNANYSFSLQSTPNQNDNYTFGKRLRPKELLKLSKVVKIQL